MRKRPQCISCSSTFLFHSANPDANWPSRSSRATLTNCCAKACSATSFSNSSGPKETVKPFSVGFTSALICLSNSSVFETTLILSVWLLSVLSSEELETITLNLGDALHLSVRGERVKEKVFPVFDRADRRTCSFGGPDCGARGNADSIRGFSAMRIPRLTRNSLSSLSPTAAPSRAIASKMLLLPLPFSPISTVIRPSPSFSCSSDLKL